MSEKYEVGILFDPKIPLIAVLIISFIMAVAIHKGTTVLAGNQSETLDETIFESPYDDFILTQGLHGLSYGHMAIDISAGKGSEIKSPIHGEVAAIYTDQLGNPTLILENNVYKVTLLHGKYHVSVGDIITIGQPVGIESNLGYTTDMLGRSCNQRECGYHTHLNVFSKELNSNINPLELINH